MSVLVCPVCREHVLLLLIGRSQLVNYNFELHSCVGDGQWMLWTAVCPSSRSYSRRYGSRTTFCYVKYRNLLLCAGRGEERTIFAAVSFNQTVRGYFRALSSSKL